MVHGEPFYHLPATLRVIANVHCTALPACIAVSLVHTKWAAQDNIHTHVYDSVVVHCGLRNR